MKQKEKRKQGMARLIELSGEKNTALISSIVLSVIGTLCQLIPFWSVYRVMAELLKHTVTGEAINTELLIRLAVYGLAGLLAGYLATYLGGMKAHTFAYCVICGVRLKAAEHIGKLPMGYVSNNSVGKIKQILDADVEQIEGFLAHQLPDLVSTVVMLMAMFIVMFTENVWLALACLIPLAVGFVCQFTVMIKIMKSGGVQQNFDALEKISSSSIQYVKGMPSIKIFGQTVRSFRQFYDDIISYRDFTTKMTEVIRPGFVRFRMFVLSVATFIVPIGLLLFLKNPQDLSFVITYLFFLILAPAAATPVLKLRGFSENMNIITEGVKRVEAILNEAPLQEAAECKIPEKHDVAFSNVRFSYDENGKTILDGVSFTAQQGEITALVGASGAGKSTIAELIPRFWDVTDGSIKIGGIDIREIRQADLMEQMSFVFQESYLLSDTIYNNIVLGKPDATKEQVEKAAMAAQCHDFIRSLPEGYQTKIGDGGVHLSGGEMQRVSIARAILKNAPILILDEASAYADAENEHEMQLALTELIKHKTVIMIAHRLTTICNANQILVVEDGKIAEAGTHEQLMRKNKRYAAMWKAGMESANWRMEQGKEVSVQ
ncbi:MAG: ABC transporter ATP-binding protein [Lachnospiraceae bacterium]|nr:ABC transporter ATP-binding protein [Lachnospiraceae bacterium]